MSPQESNLLRAGNSPSRVLHRAAQVLDGAGVDAAPGVLLVEGERVLAAGPPESVGAASDAQTIDHPNKVLIPALVNVHAHLDLTHLGPFPFTGDFRSWIDRIRAGRVFDLDALCGSVLEGVRLARAGGTAFLGDIAGAGALPAVDARREGGLPGVSFLEIFGIGRREQAGVDAVDDALGRTPREEAGVRLGLQPHAPYSCGSAVYERAVATDLPLSTHLAETLEEIEFSRRGTGPLARLLRGLGLWDDACRAPGVHPIDHLAEVLLARPWVLAHLNYVEPRHLELLARGSLTVAYCPRASAYFGHPHDDRPPHRYREMLAAGINVALGTDGLPCLDTPRRIGVFDDARVLFRRDRTPPATLIEMATVRGARALGVDPGLVSFAPGPIAGVLALEAGESDRPPIERALLREDAPVWVAGPHDLSSP